MTDERQRQRFHDLVVPHLDDALSLARWLTGNIADGEDVVQEACVRAFGALASLRDGNPRAWLLTIVRNAAFTWLAKNRPKTRIITDDERLFEGAADHAEVPTPEAAVIAAADAAALEAAIAALPLPYREVLVLREIEGLSYREIASVTALPAGTVMSRLSRARALLMKGIVAEGLHNAGTGKEGAP